jgi:hypothetical protein
VIDLPLAAVPNQSFTAQLDNNFFEITLKETAGTMAVTVNLNGTDIVTNIRAVAGEFIIPYAYLEKGNFIFLTSNDDLPYYTKFGVNQSLVYLSTSELGVIRGTN